MGFNWAIRGLKIIQLFKIQGPVRERRGQKWHAVPIFPNLLINNLVSLCLKANAEIVAKTPRCYCMLLM
jgi:hypothetical protein